MDLALNNLQRLICHKTKQTKPLLERDDAQKKNRPVSALGPIVHLFFEDVEAGRNVQQAQRNLFLRLSGNRTLDISGYIIVLRSQ